MYFDSPLPSQKGPDLRRDYDMEFWAFSHGHFESERTWFTKGLRLGSGSGSGARVGIGSSERTWFTKGLRRIRVMNHAKWVFQKVRKDLIYEGITTPSLIHSLFNLHFVRKDLIYEGITTGGPHNFFGTQVVSERTWFTKGLRPFLIFILEGRPGQKGPDLRRDYDWDCLGIILIPSYCQKGPDLRRDYDNI